MKYLTVNLCGGLGNQLWQVAASETIAKQTGRTLVFRECVSPTTQHSSINYFQDLLASWALLAPSDALDSPVVVKETSYRYQDWEELLQHPLSVILEGYFQNYRYVPDDFTSRLTLPTAPLHAPNIAFIHIRGGDYVNHWLHDVGLNTRSAYYIEAILQFAPDTTFLLFTNDRPYAEKAKWLSFVTNRVQWAPDTWSEVECLSAMAACPRGGICSNSTLAWWSAWIGASPSKKMILPNRWFNDPSIYVEGYFFPGGTVVHI